jgi:hypothetical protein
VIVAQWNGTRLKASVDVHGFVAVFFLQLVEKPSCFAVLMRLYIMACIMEEVRCCPKARET